MDEGGRKVTTEKPMLRVEFETDARLDSPYVSDVVFDLDTAFRSFALGPGQRTDAPSLSLSATYVGSFILDFLMVTGGVVTLNEGRKLLIDFVNYLGETVESMLAGGDVPTAERDALRAVSRPLVNGEAKSVQIFIVGQNERLLIDLVIAPIIVGDRLTPRLSRTAAEFGEPLPGPRVAPRSKESTSRLKSFATLIVVGDEWYARPEGFGGLLIPVTSHSLSQKEGDVVDGHIWLNKDGRPTEFRA